VCARNRRCRDMSPPTERTHRHDRGLDPRHPGTPDRRRRRLRLRHAARRRAPDLPVPARRSCSRPSPPRCSSLRPSPTTSRRPPRGGS
jgi:hypothetical protein